MIEKNLPQFLAAAREYFFRNTAMAMIGRVAG